MIGVVRSKRIRQRNARSVLMVLLTDAFIDIRTSAYSDAHLV